MYKSSEQIFCDLNTNNKHPPFGASPTLSTYLWAIICIQLLTTVITWLEHVTSPQPGEAGRVNACGLYQYFPPVIT